MNISKIILELRDYGGRRSGIDRRYFSYSEHIPERRLTNDRRGYEERRTGFERRHPEPLLNCAEGEKRVASDRRASWN